MNHPSVGSPERLLDIGPLQSRFLERLPARLAALKDAHARGDLYEMGRCGHQMHGAAGMYGFPSLGNAAANVERLARHGGSPVEIEAAMVAFQFQCVEALGATKM